jgi:hypothetical protein
VSVTVASGRKGVVGVNVAALPLRCHVPVVGGLSDGIGELAASGEEKVTVIGAVGATPTEPGIGLSETTESGCGGDGAEPPGATVVGETAAVVAVVERVADGPPWLLTTMPTTRPAPRRHSPATAIRDLGTRRARYIAI